ncbi:fructosamine kinase family protein [Cellulosimicrobium cellulans]|uniref:fructosamine kinase family protein n=1 Tax=Cellulosimicrobium cellulans TaxID=1710 RepID=UPI001ED9FBF6|nr:fructosamine kinase family protein [Cellulosimicrobium cellulans]UKJ64938.1 fructosamine kinase family protein [Cellulosimicrobium cellulans]
MRSPGGAASGVFTKSRTHAPPGFFACEAAGLAWLGVAGGPRVARVLDVSPTRLDLERVLPAGPTPEAAEAFGRALAVVHDAGAPAWGVPPPGWSGDAFFGPLDDPLPMPTGAWSDWPTFYAEARLLPVARQGRDRGALDADDARLLERLGERLANLARPALDDSPARVHGDLWSGNVLWSPLGPGPDGRPGGVEAVLIDPAAHGGHREADLAMLALFGAPYLDEIVAGYDAAHPLARGWRRRVALHQVYPVAVHAVLFGGGYRAQLRSSVRALLDDA